MRILAIGDVIGRPGIEAVTRFNSALIVVDDKTGRVTDIVRVDRELD